MLLPLRSCFSTLVLGVGLAAVPIAVGAATINAPTITVTSLDHIPGSCCDYHVDYVGFPGAYTGGSYTGGGAFSATIATGDVITIRIQAPAGKKFSVHLPPAATFIDFSFDLFWLSVGGAGNLEPNTATFEGLVGPVPQETYSLTSLSAGRTQFEVWKQYTASAPFQFRAIVVRITAASPQATATLNYSVMGSHQGASFEADAITTDPEFKIMEIVDEATTPSRATTWGRMHVLYR